MSLFGLAIMAIAEIIGSILVVWRWQFAAKQNLKESEILKNEIKCSITIGAIMLGLGFALIICSAIKVFRRPEPIESMYGIFVGIFGASASFTLYFYKLNIGRQLNSVVILADARCSKCVGLISICALLALAVEPVVQWADGVMGMMVASFTMQQGYFQMRDSWEKLELTRNYTLESMAFNENAHLLRIGKSAAGGDNACDQGITSEELDLVSCISVDSLCSDAVDSSVCSEYIDDENVTVTI